MGIIDIGVQKVVEYIDYQKDSTILLLGTPITIDSNAHRQKLIEQGVAPNKIVGQGCKDLQFEIQEGRNEVAKKMLYNYLIEAESKMVEPCSNLAVVLCCTHYHFAKAMFKEVTEAVFKIKPVILNPNEAMVKAIPWKTEPTTINKVNITHKVFSAIELTAAEIETIGTAIQDDAPAVQRALINYQSY